MAHTVLFSNGTQQYVQEIHKESFWNMVGQKLEDYADDHPELDSRLQQLGYTEAQVLTESLMTRKLRGSQAECHHMVPNPFHKYSQK